MKPTLRCPCCLAGAGPPVPCFRSEREWSAGRRQGFARPLTGACEAPGTRLTNGVATPAREARRQTSNGFAKPAERALRLPALHLAGFYTASRESGLKTAGQLPTFPHVGSHEHAESEGKT